MNGRNAEILNHKRRTSEAAGEARSFSGPGDIEAAAKEYNTAVVFTDVTAIDANTAVDRVIEDSWNGDLWYPLYTDTVTVVAVNRREVTNFAGYLRVRHVVRATSGSSQVGANYGSGLTYKQT
jgi:hypothetical protein